MWRPKSGAQRAPTDDDDDDDDQVDLGDKWPFRAAFFASLWGARFVRAGRSLLSAAAAASYCARPGPVIVVRQSAVDERRCLAALRVK